MKRLFLTFPPVLRPHRLPYRSFSLTRGFPFLTAAADPRARQLFFRRRLLPAGLLVILLGLTVNHFTSRSPLPPPLPLPPVDSDVSAQAAGYLQENHQYPAEALRPALNSPDGPGQLILASDPYLADTLDLLLYLLPLMAETGSRSLGFPYLRPEDQGLVDELLTTPAFREAEARSLFRNQNPLWGYQEYVDFLRGIHRFNQSRPRKEQIEVTPLGPGFYPDGLPPEAPPSSKQNKDLTASLDREFRANLVTHFLNPGKRGIILTPSRTLSSLSDLEIPTAVHNHPRQLLPSAVEPTDREDYYPVGGLLEAALFRLSRFHRLTAFTPSSLLQALDQGPRPSSAPGSGGTSSGSFLMDRKKRSLFMDYADYWLTTDLMGHYQAVTPLPNYPTKGSRPFPPPSASEVETGQAAPKAWTAAELQEICTRRAQEYQILLNRFPN